MITLVPDDESRHVRCRIPQRVWATMRDDEKADAFNNTLLRAVQNAIRDAPDGFHKFDMNQLDPDPLDLLDPTKEPEIILEVITLTLRPE